MWYIVHTYANTYPQIVSIGYILILIHGLLFRFLFAPSVFASADAVRILLPIYIYMILIVIRARGFSSSSLSMGLWYAIRHTHVYRYVRQFRREIISNTRCQRWLYLSTFEAASVPPHHLHSFIHWRFAGVILVWIGMCEQASIFGAAYRYRKNSNYVHSLISVSVVLLFDVTGSVMCRAKQRAKLKHKRVKWIFEKSSRIDNNNSNKN